MNIGIDIDGVLTNDDDYIMDTTSKYVFENKLEGFEAVSKKWLRVGITCTYYIYVPN